MGLTWQFCVLLMSSFASRLFWRLSQEGSVCALAHIAFAELNARTQYKGKTRRYDDPSTFESTLTRAFGPSYDPSDFLQWALVNKLVLGFANTVEPFQDEIQADAILRSCDLHGLPLFVQTKGVNFDAVWDRLRPFHDNANLFVSLPTTNQSIIKRFEPGTPPASARLAMVEKAAKAGFFVTLALSPYHEDWVDHPKAFVKLAHSLGARSVFFDRLHLNRRQREAATDKAMVGLANKSESSVWTQKCLDQYIEIYETCAELDIPIFCPSGIPAVFGLCNTTPTISPPGVYSRGLAWPYNDGLLFMLFHEWFYGDPDYDENNRNEYESIIVRWSDVLSLMESGRGVSQEFSFSSMRDLICVKTLPPNWMKHLQPAAPMAEYYRALWNDPGKGQFAWRHPWAKIALTPEGSPWTDDGGNVIMIVDPDIGIEGRSRIVEDLDKYRNLSGDDHA